MRRPNSRRIQKKPSASAFNNGRIDGASVCVCVCVCVRKGPTLKVIIGKRCHMSNHYSAIPHFRELFDCHSYNVSFDDCCQHAVYRIQTACRWLSALSELYKRCTILRWGKLMCFVLWFVRPRVRGRGYLWGGKGWGSAFP